MQTGKIADRLECIVLWPHGRNRTSAGRRCAHAGRERMDEVVKLRVRGAVYRLLALLDLPKEMPELRQLAIQVR